MGILATIDSDRPYEGGAPFDAYKTTLAAGATGYGDVVQVAGGAVVCSLDGAATSVSAVIQRSLDKVNWHLAANSALASSGNPSTGLAPVTNQEAGMAYYRVSVTASSGGVLNIGTSIRRYV